MRSHGPRPALASVLATIGLGFLGLLLASSGHAAEASGDTETREPATTTQVAVLGMIHDGHRSSKTWGLDQVRETIRNYKPEVVCAEIPPDRWPEVWKVWSERQVIEDDRVLRFPEYTDVLLPLATEMGFQVAPCAAWTREMAAERRERIQQFETAERFAEKKVEYDRRNQEISARHAAAPIVDDDPRVIHSALYDQRVKEELAPYDEMLNDWIGAGGWTHINQAHYRLVEGVLERHVGKRILITFGAGHKYWFLEQLRKRQDIELLEVLPYLPAPAAP